MLLIPTPLLKKFCSLLQLFYFSVRELLPSHKKFLEFFIQFSSTFSVNVAAKAKGGILASGTHSSCTSYFPCFQRWARRLVTNALCKQENASTLQREHKNNTICKIKTSSCCQLISWAQQDYEFICISNSEKQTKHFLSITNPIPTNSLQSPKLILLQELTPLSQKYCSLSRCTEFLFTHNLCSLETKLKKVGLLLRRKLILSTCSASVILSKSFRTSLHLTAENDAELSEVRVPKPGTPCGTALCTSMNHSVLVHSDSIAWRWF